MTNPPVIDELLPCPFCGARAVVSYNETAACDGCGANASSIPAWNRRVAPAGEQSEQAGDLPESTGSSVINKSSAPLTQEGAATHDNSQERQSSTSQSSKDAYTQRGVGYLPRTTPGTPARDGREVDNIIYQKISPLIDEVRDGRMSSFKAARKIYEMLLPTAAGAVDDKTLLAAIKAALCLEIDHNEDDISYSVLQAIRPYLATAGADKEDGWRDIGTAPKDGTEFLGARKLKGQWSYEVCRYHFNRFVADIGTPTLWRPITPPAKGE